MHKLLRLLVDRRSEMERSVFASPPADWAAFQKRLGQYVELDQLIVLLEESIRGVERDEG